MSTVTAQELVRVLAYPKFRLSASALEELLADNLPYTTTVRISYPAPAVPACRDPADLPFLHLAVAGQATGTCWRWPRSSAGRLAAPSCLWRNFRGAACQVPVDARRGLRPNFCSGTARDGMVVGAVAGQQRQHVKIAE